ncbi:MAG: AMP-binding protein, partial [Pseudomonadota bacterium]
APMQCRVRTPCRREPLAMLMYSSGTTGRPKGVMLTHENIFYSICQGASVIDFDRNLVSHAAMPLFHIAAVMGFSIPALYYAGFAVVERAFDPTAMLKTISDPDIGVTHFIGVPAMMNMLLHHPDSAKIDFSCVKGALSGAEAVPESLLQAWFERGVRVQEVYGMTETTGGTCVVPVEDVPGKIGSSGKPMLFSEFKIMKSETEEAAPGDIGEIWMRGPVVTPGYWRRPEANEKSFVDGWLRSGDIGRIDNDGYIYVEDRVKDMYISGGENVYPAEIENVLYKLPEIHEVAVVGVPDAQWGESGCVVAVFKAGQDLDFNAIVAHCEGSLAKYKHPKHLVVKQALPRNATGKVLKFVMREELKRKFG